MRRLLYEDGPIDKFPTPPDPHTHSKRRWELNMTCYKKALTAYANRDDAFFEVAIIGVSA